MHKSAKAGWTSNRAVRLVLQRTGCVGEVQVIVDSDTLQGTQGPSCVVLLSSGDRGPCRYQGHRPRRVWLAQIVAGGLCVFRNSLDTSDCRASAGRGRLLIPGTPRGRRAQEQGCKIEVQHIKDLLW